MAVNKVEFGGNTLIDLTSDSVTPEALAEGETAHNSAGEEIVGTLNLNEYQKKTDETLETESKEVVGAINELNGKTVDKIQRVTEVENSAQDISISEIGISWDNNVETTVGEDTYTLSGKRYLPIVAGDNVSFGYDMENQLVKINSIYQYNATYSYSCYDITVLNLQSVTVGMVLTIIPDATNSRAGVILRINESIANEIMRPTYDGHDVTGFEIVEMQWFNANQPYRVMFDGTYWVLLDYPILSYSSGDTGGGYPDETDYFLGTWVFSDEIALESVSDSFEFTVDNYGSSSETRYFDAMECTEDELYYNDVYESSPSIAYNGSDGWWYDEPSLQTINIKTEPTDKAFKTWLYENAVKQESYPDDSGSSYPDETDYFLGTWYFKNTLSLESVSDDFRFECEMYYGSDYVEYTMGFENMRCDGEDLYYNDGSDDYLAYAGSSRWDYSSESEDYRTIIITTEPTNDDFKAWLYANASKQDGYPDETSSEYPDESGS